MWVSKYNRWHKDVTALEKLLTERIVQRCDYGELINNKHRTANGYTQLKEFIHLCNLSHKRSRTVKTLIVLLEEASCKELKQNIANDYIIGKYFVDLRTYVLNVVPHKLLADKNQPNLTELNRLQHHLKIFELQLDSHYFEVLKKEFLEFDYQGETKFQQRADLLSDLIDILVPYLVFKGYSIASLSEVLISWLRKGYRPTAKRIFDFFHFQVRPFYFLQHLGPKSAEVDDFIELLKDDLKVQIDELPASQFGEDFTSTNNLEPDNIFASYGVKVMDPHNHVRYNYDELLKRVVIKKERQSLSTFNDYFDHSFWSHTPPIKIKNLNPIALDGDPINVNSRGRSFRNTLMKCSTVFGYSFTDETDVPTADNLTLRNSIYYYNLALGSKSIENSLSLLWTTLESLIPYRMSGSDIECVQHVLSKGLSIGSICRDIHGFALRFIQQNQQNDNMLATLGTRAFATHYSPEGLEQWFNWISDASQAKNRHTIIKSCSELLTYQYSKIGKPYSEGTLELLLGRIESSKMSIKYQLQRIYLHRNQIVHAGDMVNEYSNLWMHLEWYVGKLLAYFFIQMHFLKKYFSLETAFRQLEADHDYLVSYIKMNRTRKISTISSRVGRMLFEHSWQSF
jgi:hypothetical protein